MTYRELKKQLENLSESQLDCDVTVFDSNFDEFVGCYGGKLYIQEGDDVLDDKHPYLYI